MTEKNEPGVDDLAFFLGAWRWFRESVVIAVSVLTAVALVVGLLIGEVRLADALVLGVLAFAGMAFLLARVKRIYPRVFPSGPGANRARDRDVS